MKPISDLPEPVCGTDYYIDELRRYTVTIDVEVTGLHELELDEIESRAVNGFRSGKLDGDSQIVHDEKIKDVKLDFETDKLFDEAAWRKVKLFERGLNTKGEPLRPHEKVRPVDETTLDMFATWETWVYRCIDWMINTLSAKRHDLSIFKSKAAKEFFDTK